MSTRTIAPHARRYRPLLFLVAGILVMLAVGSGITAGAEDPPCKDAAVVKPALMTHATGVSSPAAESSTGLDLELRIWNLRIEFPWLKKLPVRPARHIVVSVLATS